MWQRPAWRIDATIEPIKLWHPKRKEYITAYATVLSLKQVSYNRLGIPHIVQDDTDNRLADTPETAIRSLNNRMLAFVKSKEGKDGK